MEIYNALPDELQREVRSFEGTEGLMERLKQLKRLQYLVGRYNTNYKGSWTYDANNNIMTTKFNLKMAKGVEQYEKFKQATYDVASEIRCYKRPELTTCCCRPVEYRDVVYCPDGHACCRVKSIHGVKSYPYPFLAENHFCKICRELFSIDQGKPYWRWRN